MKKLLYLSFISLLSFCFAAPALAQEEGDGVNPPIRPESVSVLQAATSVDIVFLVDVDDAQVELVKCCDGAMMFEAFGSIPSNQRVSIAVSNLCVGKYTLRVRVCGSVVKEIPLYIE